MSNSAARSTLYKKTHVERYTSHKEVIYSEPEYPNFRSRYFILFYLLKQDLLHKIKIIQSYFNRYLSWANTPLIGKYDASRADSDTELDETFASKLSVKTDQSWRIVQWFTYFTTFIVAWFRKTVGFFKFKTDRKRQYYGAQAYRLSNGIIGI